MENLFEKLMDQIKMPPNLRRSRQFEHADIENVEVHTASKLWHFQLIFDEILPIDTYKLLTELSAMLTVLLSTTKMLTIQSHFTDNFSDFGFDYILWFYKHNRLSPFTTKGKSV